MRSRFALLLFFVAALSMLNMASAGAQTSDDASSTELLSYSELMHLSRDKQIEYINGIRAILVDLAKNPNSRISDSDVAARSKLKAWLEWLNDEIKSAKASEKNRCADNKDCESKMMECYIRRIGVKWVDGAYHCDDQRKIELPVMASSFLASRQNEIVQALKDAVNDPQSAAAESGPIVLDLKTTHTSDSESAKSDAPVARIDMAAAKAASDAAVAKTAGLLRSANQPDPKFGMSEAPKNLVRAPVESTGESSSEKTADTETENTVSAVEFKEVVTSPPTAAPAKIVAPSRAKTERVKRPKAQAKAAALPDLSKYACAPKPDVCGDPEKTRKGVFEGNLACVFAGMVSKLDLKNRKCSAVTEFKLGETTYKCSSGQTMCNPLLFGTVSTTKPICVGRGSDVTAQCGRLSSAHDAEVFLNRNETGLQNRWDEFRTEMKKVCAPGKIQAKFYCVECNVMKARIFELHARLVKDPCGKSDLSDFDKVIKARTPARGGATKK